MNPLEIRVLDDRDGGRGVGVAGESDLVDIVGPPSLFSSSSSPRRVGSGGGGGVGSVSPRLPWKSPKKSGKTKNRQSRRFVNGGV